MNEIHFTLRNGVITDSVVGRKIIEEVEGGKYVDTTMFIGKFAEGAIDASCLSTGSKTLFNILNSYNEVYCFNTVECGDNALQFMLDNLDGDVLIVPNFL